MTHVCIKIIGDWATPFIDLDAHPDFIAVVCHAIVIIYQQVRLDHLQRQWDSAIPKWLIHHTDNYLTTLSTRTHNESFNVMEIQTSTNITRIFFTPLMPC